MSEVASSPAGDSASPASGETDPALVQIANDAEAASIEFTDAPPSEWAFAAHEASLNGEAIDTMRDPEDNGVTHLVVAATFIVAESDLFGDAQDALVSMSPAMPAFEAAGPGTDAGETTGMVMWSGAEGESSFVDEPIAAHVRGDAVLVPHDVVSHGMSLDWTDTLLSYS